jgi:hypothetical protein
MRYTGSAHLSRLLETEAPSLGIAGKQAGWLALSQLENSDQLGANLDNLIEGAADQRRRLEPLKARRRQACIQLTPSSHSGGRLRTGADPSVSLRHDRRLPGAVIHHCRGTARVADRNDERDDESHNADDHQYVPDQMPISGDTCEMVPQVHAEAQNRTDRD